MNFNDPLDPQIADILFKRPCQDLLSRYVAGMTTLAQAELIEAHMQRSLAVRIDIEALRQDLESFSESIHQSLLQQESEAASVLMSDISARDSHTLALAASYNEERPGVLFLEDSPCIPDGLGGHASASSEAPLWCSTLRITKEGSAAQEPESVQVSWPRGKRLSHKWNWEESRQKWRTDVVVPEPWSEVFSWIATGKLIITI